MTIPGMYWWRNAGGPSPRPRHNAHRLDPSSRYLPGQPKAIAETLEGLKDKDGNVVVSGIFASVPYCIQLLDGPYVETDPTIVKAFRPKSAIRVAE